MTYTPGIPEKDTTEISFEDLTRSLAGTPGTVTVGKCCDDPAMDVDNREKHATETIPVYSYTVYCTNCDQTLCEITFTLD